MNKIFAAILMTMVVFGFASGVFAQEATQQQTVTADLLDFIQFSVAPGAVLFGNIPYSETADVAGGEVTMSVLGSSTEDGLVYVTVEVQDVNPAFPFFGNLLKFDDAGTFFSVHGYTTDITVVQENKSVFIHLQGDTTAYDAGPKSATVVYTATSTPPTL